MRPRLILAVALVACVAAGCRRLPPSKPDSQLTPVELRGQQVYRAACAQCHLPNTTRPLHGPGFQALFKQPWLPSGAPADDAHVEQVVRQGRNMMPAFHNTISDAQMSDLLAYLHTL